MKKISDLVFKNWKSSLVGLILLAASSLLAYIKLHAGEKLDYEYFMHLFVYVGMAVWFLLKTDVSQMVEVFLTDQSITGTSTTADPSFAQELVNQLQHSHTIEVAPAPVVVAPEPEPLPEPVVVPEPVQVAPYIVPVVAEPAPAPNVMVSLNPDEAKLVSSLLAKFQGA